MDQANKMTSENVNIVQCSITEASLCRKKRDSYTEEMVRAQEDNFITNPTRTTLQDLVSHFYS